MKQLWSSPSITRISIKRETLQGNNTGTEAGGTGTGDPKTPVS